MKMRNNKKKTLHYLRQCLSNKEECTINKHCTMNPKTSGVANVFETKRFLFLTSLLGFWLISGGSCGEVLRGNALHGAAC